MAQESFSGGGSFLGTFVLAFIAIAALFAIDTFLASTERTEERAEAARTFAQGQQLIQQGDYAEGIDRLRDAAAMERDNRVYRLALAQGFLAAGRLADAENSLTDLLQQDSTDGASNLAMARVLVKDGKVADGISFYHRAIYGSWKDHPGENRVKARFELIDLLARQNAKEELLAELLPLQEEAPNDLGTAKRIGRLFLAAGSSSHATDVFRDILRRQPQDPDAYAGLGDAEFARGNYQTAESDFRIASRLNLDDETVQARLELCNQILALDPMRLGLNSQERYHRGLKLLQLALEDVNRCLRVPSSPDIQQLLDAANREAKHSVTQTHFGDALETDVSLAEQLWQVRLHQCGSPSLRPKTPWPWF